MSSSSKNLLLLISGASRGLGRAIAEAFCRDTTPCCYSKIRFVLMARSMDGLVATQQALQRIGGQTNDDNMSIQLHQIDCSDLDQLESRLDLILNELAPQPPSTPEHLPPPFDQVIFINNHGSIGHIGPCWTTPSLMDMRKAVDLNVTSCLWMSARVARFCKTSFPTPAACIIVNVSSLVAIQPFASLGLYSAGKAARDSYHTAMAMEGHGDWLRVLNYAPGPLETDMVTEIRGAPLLNAALRPHYDKQLIDPANSAEALVKLLVEDNFETGSHVDYFDLVPENA